MIEEARLKNEQHGHDVEGIHPIPLAPPSRRELPAPGFYPRTNLIHLSLGRQAIMRRLDGIRLDRVFFDNLPLAEVVRSLNDEARKRDPEKKGINFIIKPNDDSGAAAQVDPTTGLPTASAAPAEAVDVGAIAIKINPPLMNVRLADVLDAIVKVADKPIRYSIEDYAIVFSLKGHEASPLYVRIIKVDPNTFMQGLKSVVGVPSSNTSRGTSSSGGPQGNTVQATVRQFFSSLGMDFTPPKNIFFDDREGRLIARATLQDLDTIETAVQVLNIAPPQVNIKIKYIELPEAEAKALWETFAPTNRFSVGSNLVVLTEAAARLQRKKWEAISQVNVLNEASITTLSGRQTEIQCDVAPSDSTNSLVVGSTGGPILDVIASVAPGASSIQMTITNTINEFLGYDDPGQFVAQVRTTNSLGQPPPRPLPVPRFRLHQVNQNAIIGDGQTLVLGLGEEPIGASPPNTSTTFTKKRLMILVTPTIIDPAGNRLHTDEGPNPLEGR